MFIETLLNVSFHRDRKAILAKHWNHHVRYSTLEAYDAIYCVECDEWLETGCPEEDDCPECRGRPERPSMVPALAPGGQFDISSE